MRGSLWILIASLTWMACSEPPPPRNLVLIVLDSIRADRLSSYGYPLQTSPHLDSLAAEGVLFEINVSNSSSTLPSMAGLFAGDYPKRDVFDNRLKRSLVEKIRAAGIRTAAFVGGGSISKRFGFERGFDYFRESDGEDATVSLEETFANAATWIRQNYSERFFLVIHSNEPDLPYWRQDYTKGLDSGHLGETFEKVDAAKVRSGQLEFGASERIWLSALYDAGLNASDLEVGKLLETLKQLGIQEQTAVVVTSGHGGDLGGRHPEWPGSHGHNLYDESLLVPLIIYDPSRDYPVQRVTTQIRTIDTLPTVLDLLGLPLQQQILGQTLVPVMDGSEAGHRIAWSTVERSKTSLPEHPKRFALRSGTHKLIVTPRPRGRLLLELYDLASDPGERSNTAETQPKLRVQLFKALINFRDALRRAGVARYPLDANHAGGASEPLRNLDNSE
jgi:arylsulfatase A-like enzyme